MGDRVDCTLGSRINHASRRRQPAHDGTDVDDRAALAQILRRLPRRQNGSEYIRVEDPVELRFLHFVQRREGIDAGIVHQHVQPPKRFLRLRKQPLDVGGLRHIALHSDGLSTLWP